MYKNEKAKISIFCIISVVKHVERYQGDDGA